MALTFPLSLAEFADKLGLLAAPLVLRDNRELSGMGSGQIIEADLSPSLWGADVTTRPWRAIDARRLEALANAVIRSKGSFYLYDPRKAVPAFDPGGAVLGASVVKIASLPDAKSMGLKGLPADYKLSVGDHLCFDYGSPARRAFHEIAEDVTADGSGVTGAFEVTPFIRPGAAVDLVVTLFKPAVKMRIVPGSLSIRPVDAASSQISFSVVQKL
ncbi:MAG: hypothetical protein ACTHOP_25165 [Mesorhizobium sp.]